jgi:hypothetical protein
MNCLAIEKHEGQPHESFTARLNEDIKTILEF